MTVARAVTARPTLAASAVAALDPELELDLLPLFDELDTLEDFGGLVLD
ncbi:hypothetical protein PF005_g25592 [Phytophthora fragariae]|uniref:Uncharacterized protein n=1 Tax=Phytophthora fragariae TaxID=53985 RepID=A0A6A3VWZ4_9STRA|nr:hypothetical protein PF003_g35531 [Phytophthora fragariae]KAE8923607.1 hypothetical protein PF009_g26149 [Phytophthora fragariae]KAE9074097.1 hypothetical protein PF007_g25547 [Phytophthora fragariae]KAE9074751.1 hypothetical protein PF010_g24556 [Phytophthora fragariae]KAE9093930.1 hypothetical protein PF006_g24331 [Phytophthora fragariae]